MELFLDVLGETLVDTAKMLPFLFLAYLLIEYIEHRHGERIEALLAGGGRWGAVPGAVLGCVPQCGFSAIASNFYASRVITLGTLMAVYLATSDEAIPLLVSMPAYWDKLAVLMVIKVLYAIAVGFVLDFVLRGVLPKGLRGGYTGHADEVDCHEEHSDAEGNEKPIWQAALRHTLEIFVFIFVFSLVFGMIVEGVGEDVFAEVLGGMGFFQPVVAALVGLIPNCAASVLLTQLYVEGALRFSSLVAGLCTGAGVGLAVLWRANPSWKQNLFITGLTWVAGAFVGACIVYAMFKGQFDATEDAGTKLGVFSTSASVPSKGRNIFCEAVATFVLVFAIKGIPAGTVAGVEKFMVFGIIVSIGMSLGGLTGYALNPARDLGPRLAHSVLPIKGKGSSHWDYAVVPLVGPILGALAAVALYAVIPW